ncbi:MAG: fibronectin type III domain-containing protein [Prevotella sp.]|nr:fibronectin type III domain-containing protein [Prevotella sp.]
MKIKITTSRCRTWVLRLFLLTMTFAYFAEAQAQYELTLYSKDLNHKSYTTSTNNATCGSLKSGTIKFNASTGEVTLINVVFENTLGGMDGGFMSLSSNSSSGGSGTIVIKGTNKITSGGQRPIRLTNYDATFRREMQTGDNEQNCILDITCTSQASYGISLNNSSMFVSNCTVNIRGGAYGISGEHSNSYENLSTTHAIISAKGGTASIGRLGGLSLGNGSTIRRPAGAAYNSSLHGIALNGKLVTDEVFICDSNYGDQLPPEVGVLYYSQLTDNSITLKWTAATDNITSQANLEYTLKYKRSSSASWLTAFSSQKGITEYPISNLISSMDYDFLLSVCDEEGNESQYKQRTFTIKDKYYKFKVGGVEVTAANASNITSSSIQSGKVSYDAENNILTLDNAVIYGSGLTLVNEVGQGGLNIKLVGENSITNTSITAAALWGKSKIYGSGSLVLQAPEGAGSSGLYVYKESELTIDSTTVSVRGAYGIDGQSFETSKLVLRKSNVTAFGVKGSVRYFKDVTFDGCHITQPEGGHFTDLTSSIVDGGGVIVTNKDVVIVRDNVYIGGVGMAPGTTISDDIGTITLSEDNKTLTLDNAAILTGVIGIELLNVDDFTIILKGNNAIEATGMGISAIYDDELSVKGKLTIKGSGTLDITAPQMGIMYNLCDLNVKDCRLVIESSGGFGGSSTALLYILLAIFGNVEDIGSGTAETLTVDNAEIFFVHDGGTFCLIDGLYLNRCAITQPVGGEYQHGYICVDGEQYSGVVCISRLGAPTAIDGISEQPAEDIWHTLGGLRINQPNKPGLYIRNGEKVIVK